MQHRAGAEGKQPAELRLYQRPAQHDERASEQEDSGDCRDSYRKVDGRERSQQRVSFLDEGLQHSSEL